MLIPWENMFLRQIFHVLFHKHLQTRLQLGFLGVQGCQVPGGVHLWVVPLNQRIYIIENAVPHFPSLSQTPCLWGDVHQLALIKDNFPQTSISAGRTTQMWHALSIFRRWPFSLFPAKQPRACLLPIPTFRSSLPDWTPLITCQLDWLQVFIICDDRADLEANLNQGCRGAGEHRSSSRTWTEALPRKFNLHFLVRWLCVVCERSFGRESKHWQTSRLWVWACRLLGPDNNKEKTNERRLSLQQMTIKITLTFWLLGGIFSSTSPASPAVALLGSEAAPSAPGDNVVPWWTWLGIVWKAPLRIKHQCDDNGLAATARVGMCGWDAAAD